MAVDGARSLEAGGGLLHGLAARQDHARQLAALTSERAPDDGEQVLLVHAGLELVHDRPDGGIADAARLVEADQLLLG